MVYSCYCTCKGVVSVTSGCGVGISGCGFGFIPSPPPQVPVEVYAMYCHKKVEKMTQMGAKKGLKKPTLEEVIRAKVGVHRGVEPWVEPGGLVYTERCRGWSQGERGGC